MNNGNSTLVRSFERSLRGLNRSPRTIQSYGEAVGLLGDFYPETSFADITREMISEFLADQLECHKPATAAVRYRSLRRFFNWLAEEEIVDRSPMAGMSAPSVPEEAVPVLRDDDLAALLKVTGGKGFEQRRDHAILRLFLDTGIRLGEMSGLQLDDLDLDVHDVAHVMGKGSRPRACPFGSKTGTALDRYLRERAKHKQSRLPNLWIGPKGAMTVSGIRQMLERRGAEAGIENLHPHRFRHTFAHHWKKDGGNEDDLMRLTGWRSRTMLSRYAASAADDRARAAHKRMGLGDKF